jgi:hypothetical protein
MTTGKKEEINIFLGSAILSFYEFRELRITAESERHIFTLAIEKTLTSRIEEEENC